MALGLLVGAVAKSAQLPLQTWLPDAMEGPTPVSALIHAATMVTAGVYLVARTHVIFENAPDIHNLVAILGLATLLMAGVIAMVQTDIKRIIAYSTMSQIGYMFTAVGVGAYSQGMFLLLPTPSSRRCCSSAPVSSSTPSRPSRTCARWADWARRCPRPSG